MQTNISLSAFVLGLAVTLSAGAQNEVAAWFGVSLETLDRWHRAGKGPPRFKIGGCYRYRVKPAIRTI
jgi:hypothetical protein